MSTGIFIIHVYFVPLSSNPHSDDDDCVQIGSHSRHTRSEPDTIVPPRKHLALGWPLTCNLAACSTLTIVISHAFRSVLRPKPGQPSAFRDVRERKVSVDKKRRREAPLPR